MRVCMRIVEIKPCGVQNQQERRGLGGDVQVGNEGSIDWKSLNLKYRGKKKGMRETGS